MVGDLTNEQIEQVLRRGAIGRIGCHENGRTYVVPVAYAYLNGYIYGHTGEGLKLQMMRANPVVCFEVEHLESMASWDTVIAWGVFEELHDEAAREGMRLLVRHLNPLVTGHPETADERLQPMMEELVTRALQLGVVYRIRLTETTGRFERNVLAASQAARSLGHPLPA